MEPTRLISKVIGPVLLLRAVSILLDRQHFLMMLRGVDHEISTLAFSLFPIALLMACITLAIVPLDASPAAVLIRLMAWGGIAKASALIVAPHIVAAKAKLLEHVAILDIVLGVCTVVGAYFTWYGYFARGPSVRSSPSAIEAVHHTDASSSA